MKYLTTIIISVKELKHFYSYVWSFYGGNDPLYPIKGLTKEMIIKATSIYLNDPRNTWCDGDSIDREHVRDIILKTFNLEWN